MKLNRCQDITAVPIGYTWKSRGRTSGYLWTLCFGFLTGDFNKDHVLPFSFFRSVLGGLVRHGVSTLAQAEACVFQVLSFVEPTAVIALGYNSVEYLKPARVGSRITYRYTLQAREVSEGKAKANVVWLVEAIDKQGNVITRAIWRVLYCRREPRMIVLRLPWMSLKFSVKEVWGGVVGSAVLVAFFWFIFTNEVRYELLPP